MISNNKVYLFETLTPKNPSLGDYPPRKDTQMVVLESILNESVTPQTVMSLRAKNDTSLHVISTKYDTSFFVAYLKVETVLQRPYLLKCEKPF